MVNLLDVEDYLYKSLELFEKGPADLDGPYLYATDYQIGYRNALKDLLTWIDMQRKKENT